MTTLTSGGRLSARSLLTTLARAAANPALRSRIATALMAGLLGSAGMTGCAAAGPLNPDGLRNDEVERIGQICQSVIRVEPGEAYFDGCVSSLSDSVRNLSSGRAVAQARDDCRKLGLTPGSPDLAECVLKLSADRPDAPDVQASGVRLAEADQMAEPGSSKSYFYTSPRDVFRREQLSCARLGFDPAGAAFGDCVANLAATLSQLDDPQP